MKFNKLAGQKLLKTFVSVLMVFVLSFCLFGCGEKKVEDDGVNNGGNRPSAPDGSYGEGTYGSRIKEVSDAQDAETFFVCVGTFDYRAI